MVPHHRRGVRYYLHGTSPSSEVEMIRDLKWTPRLREKIRELSVLLYSSQGLCNLACMMCFSFCVHLCTHFVTTMNSSTTALDKITLEISLWVVDFNSIGFGKQKFQLSTIRIHSGRRENTLSLSYNRVVQAYGKLQ